MGRAEIVIGTALTESNLMRPSHGKIQSINPDCVLVEGKHSPLRDIESREINETLKNVHENDISVSCTGITREHLKEDKESSESIKNLLIKNGVADIYIHTLLPDLEDMGDRKILIGAGKVELKKTTDKNFPLIWLPNANVDNKTLSILSDFGYEGMICAPEQTYTYDSKKSDSRSIKVDLPNGKQFYAVAFDNPISRKLLLAGKKEIENEKGKTSIAFLDSGIITKENSDRIKNLVEELDINIVPMSEFDYRKSEKGIIYERSSWNPYGIYHDKKNHNNRNESFYKTLLWFNLEISKIIGREMKGKHVSILIRDFPKYLNNPGGTFTTQKDSLISAKASSLAACSNIGTNYDDLYINSKKNILYTLQSLSHLRDAGFNKEADAIGQNLYSGLYRSIGYGKFLSLFTTEEVGVLSTLLGA